MDPWRARYFSKFPRTAAPAGPCCPQESIWRLVYAPGDLDHGNKNLLSVRISHISNSRELLAVMHLIRDVSASWKKRKHRPVLTFYLLSIATREFLQSSNKYLYILVRSLTYSEARSITFRFPRNGIICFYAIFNKYFKLSLEKWRVHLMPKKILECLKKLNIYANGWASQVDLIQTYNFKFKCSFAASSVGRYTSVKLKMIVWRVDTTF